MRLRFAPSPTGHLHVGGARTALFNWLLARKEGADFVLRIEDTDRARSSEEHVRAILEGMSWLGLDWDEGPHLQSDGAERHRIDALRLLAEGHAYRDFTTPGEAKRDRERLSEDPGFRPGHAARERADAVGEEESRRKAEAGEPFALRFRVPEGETVWNDLVHGEVRFDNADVDDLVVLRRDGTATYNLAVVSDDADAGISHVIRGDDHLSNTPKQILLYEALGMDVPRFGHVPMILGPDGSRLSKRHGATAVGEYEGRGILPQAMVNFLALLGWSPGDDREVMELDELVRAFSMDRVLKKSAVFDTEKLEWLNGQHIARTSAAELAPLLVKTLSERYGVPSGAAEGDPDRLRNLIHLLKPRSRTIREMAEQALPYLRDELDFDDQAVRKQWGRDPAAATERLEAVREQLASTAWQAEALEEDLRGLAGELGIGLGKLVHPLRVALTGRSASFGIFDVLLIVGRERSLRRIDEALEMIRSGRLPLGATRDEER